MHDHAANYAAEAEDAFPDILEGEEEEARSQEGWIWPPHDSQGMAEEDVERLPCRVLASEEETEALSMCVVCQEALEIGASVTYLPCSHTFHQACLERWLVLIAKCPTCKHELGGSPFGSSGLGGD